MKVAYLSSASRAVTLVCRASLSSTCSSMSLWAFLLSASILSSSVSPSSTCLFRAFTLRVSWGCNIRWTCVFFVCSRHCFCLCKFNIHAYTWSLCSVCVCLSSSSVRLSSLSFLSRRRWDANTEFFSLCIQEQNRASTCLWLTQGCCHHARKGNICHVIAPIKAAK